MTPKLSELFYTDIVYKVKIDNIPASYDINNNKKTS